MLCFLKCPLCTLSLSQLNNQNEIKMKTKLFHLLFVCLSGMVRAQQVNDSFIAWTGQISFISHWKGDPDEWKGGSDDRDIDNRSMPIIPISAIIENEKISIDFWDVTGDVTVSITEKDGLEIYSQPIFVNEYIRYDIAIGTYSPGVYLLKISNQDDGYIYGWFEVK